MKNIVYRIIVSLAFFAASASFASAEGQSKEAIELPKFTVDGIDSMPTLTKSPMPLVRPDLVGTEIRLRLTISKTGKPTSIRSATPLPGIGDPRARDFAVLMTNTVKHWRFGPAKGANGEAKALKVLMPIRVTERDDKAIVQVTFKPLSAN